MLTVDEIQRQERERCIKKLILAKEAVEDSGAGLPLTAAECIGILQNSYFSELDRPAPEPDATPDEGMLRAALVARFGTGPASGRAPDEGFSDTVIDEIMKCIEGVRHA